jgi:hypothetical protein
VEISYRKINDSLSASNSSAFGNERRYHVGRLKMGLVGFCDFVVFEAAP